MAEKRLSQLPSVAGTTLADADYLLCNHSGLTYTVTINDLRIAIGKWPVARTVNMTGDVTGNFSIDGSANVSFTASLATVPVNKGGTGGTDQATARSGLGLKKAALADIVGTVSQTGGVPTGDISQILTATGGHRAVRYADGTQICTGPMPDLAVTATGVTGSPSVTMAAAMIDTAYVVTVNAAPSNSDVYGFVYYPAKTTTSFAAAFRNGATAQTLTALRYLAVGKWF